MGLLDRMFGGKLPSWAKSSPHDAKSAAALVETIQAYVVENGGSIELGEDSAKVRGPRGERTVRFGDFVFICPADSTETWGKMIAHALRDLIPDAAVIAEARVSLEQLLRERQSELDAIAGSRDKAQASLRLALRTRTFRPEVPELVKAIKRDVLDRYEAIAVYDFLPEIDGLPAGHLAALDLSPDELLARAEENSFAAAFERSGERVVALAGPFAGTRIISPARSSDESELGLLVTSPHQDLFLFHAIREANVLEALEEMVQTMVRHEGGPPGGTGRLLYWWRKGVFQEIPKHAKTIVRDGCDPYEYRLPDRFKRDVLKPLGIESA